MAINLSELLGVQLGSGLAGTWDMAASPSLPTGHAAGFMYEIIGEPAIRNGSRFVAGDIAMVNLDDATVVNLTNKGVTGQSTAYAILADDENLVGTLSGGNLTITGVASTGARLDRDGSATKRQIEVTVDAAATTGDGGVFAGVWEGNLTLAQMFTTAEDNGYFIVYLQNMGAWVYYKLTLAGAPTFGLIPEWTDPIAEGDVITVAYDSATRVVQAKLNGVSGSLGGGATVPGTAEVRFAVGQNGGTGNTVTLTVNPGPTFSSPFATYVGVYSSVSTYEGGFRVMGRNWNPADGYPDFELAGDLYYASVAGVVPADGEQYFAGEGVYWDGAAARHFNDSPLNLGAMYWAGDLELPDVPNDANAAAMPTITDDMEGKVYRVPQYAYVPLTVLTALDLVKVFPKGSMVMVKDGEWQLLTYDYALYFPSKNRKQALSRDVAPVNDGSPNYVVPFDFDVHPISGNGQVGSAITDGVQFEHTVQYAGTVDVSTKIGIWLPFSPDGTTTYTYSDCVTPTAEGQLFFFYDFVDKALKLTWHDGAAAQSLVVADLSTETIVVGDVLDFTCLRGSFVSGGIVGFYVNSVHKGSCNVLTETDLALNTYTWGFSAFSYNPTGTNDDRIWFDSNAGERPFRYVHEPAEPEYLYGYIVPLAGGLPITSINGLSPDSTGDLTLPGNIVTFVTTQPLASQGNDGEYALDVARGRLYGPKSGGSWGGTDLSPLAARTNYSNQIDRNTVQGTTLSGPAGVGDQLTVFSGRRRVGFKIVSNAPYDSTWIELNVGQLDTDFSEPIVPVVCIERSQTYAQVRIGTVIAVINVASYVDGEEWGVVLDYDDETATVIAPGGDAVTAAYVVVGVPTNISGLALQPYTSHLAAADTRVELQPDGNGLTGEPYDSQGWQVTPNPYQQLNEDSTFDDIVSVSANYVLQKGDGVVKVDCTGASRTVTLPFWPNHRQKVTVINVTPGSPPGAYPIISGNGRLINGASSLNVPYTQWSSYTIQFDATDNTWVTI